MLYSGSPACSAQVAEGRCPGPTEAEEEEEEEEENLPEYNWLEHGYRSV